MHPTRRRQTRASSGSRMRHGCTLRGTAASALTSVAEVACRLAAGVAILGVSVSIAIIAIVPVVAVIAGAATLYVVEHDAEHSGAHRGQQARGMLGGITTGASVAQDQHHAFNAWRQDQGIADAEQRRRIEDDMRETPVEGLQRLA